MTAKEYGELVEGKVTKINQVSEIEIVRVEGPIDECDIVHTVKSFAEADKLLRGWAGRMSKYCQGGYDKVKFFVKWGNDGSDTYAGRFDMEYDHNNQSNILNGQIKTTIEFEAGDYRPDHFTDEMWDRHLASESYWGDASVLREWLATHEL